MEDLFGNNIEKIILRTEVKKDQFTDYANQIFDLPFTGISEFELPVLIDYPKKFSIGLIVGASGSGKSQLLKHHFGSEEKIEWDNSKCVMAHFETPEQAAEKFGFCGFSSIPSWVKPYYVLSNGEKFRVDLARKIKNNAIIDEFTSVIDRNVAKAASVAIRKYVDKKNIENVVFASCHKDIIEWLQPDWVFDTDTKELKIGRSLWRRPIISLKIYRTDTKIWDMFAKHHYLDSEINKCSDCYIGIWENTIVAFDAILPFPNGSIKNGWRDHRLVVLPDYQGLGIGNKFSECIAEHYIKQNKRFYAKTANPKLGEYRNKSPKWKPTSQNGKQWNGKETGVVLWKHFANRTTYSHEYVGENLLK